MIGNNFSICGQADKRTSRQADNEKIFSWNFMISFVYSFVGLHVIY
jgi:hypothetical protein